MVDTEPIELCGAITLDVKAICDALMIPASGDAKMRRFEVGGVECCLFYVDGMAGNALIDEYILFPCRAYAGAVDCAPCDLASFFSRRVITASDVTFEDVIAQIAAHVLSGKTALVFGGCREALVVETRNFEKRPVGKTISESVVMGAQQGFVESVRTNITLLRRILKSPMLITEFHTVGTQMPTSLALVYLKGGCNEVVLEEIRRRVLALSVWHVADVGCLQQLIENRRFMLIPKTLLTERPDRAAALIAEGHIALMMDNSPYALIAPVSLFDFMFTADDNFMRWQYSTFNRLVRFFGLIISLTLPGFYIALTLFHTQMIPIELLSSIAEARAKVPFPVIIELLIMEFSFYLINEAGTRMPTQIGSALGIVGALILGQAAVSANIISPLLIIIAALTGLGNYAIPDYGLGIAVQIMRLVFLGAGAVLGLFGMALMTFVCLSMLSAMDSFGQPYLAPRAPWRPSTEPSVIRIPPWRNNRMPFFVPEGSWLRRTPGAKKMRDWEGEEP